MSARLGVLISGRGSNMRSLAEAVDAGQLDATIALVLSNHDDAPGLAWARAAGLETACLSHRGWASRDDYDRALVCELQARSVTLVCLAGFMRRIGSPLLDAFPNAILNVHPSLLPAFPGLDAPRQAIAYGARVSGVTVHLVTSELDSGPVIVQRAVPVQDDDTAETLSARILAEEHRAYPEAVRRVLTSGWRLDGRRFVPGPDPGGGAT